MSYSLHCTKKLLDRIKPQIEPGSDEPGTLLGNWYATALFWRPQLVLLVNERTLLPVLLPLAPATTLADRFPQQLESVLTAHGVARERIAAEIAQMSEVRYAKTASRSHVGVMNEFSFLAEVYRDHPGTGDLIEFSLKLAEVPCGPLYKRLGTPERELQFLFAIQPG
ncbi:hypothetical protein [Collimonas sp. OK412]|jgi:hypothetical protein|uniref:DUF6933 domain-containing protein n=1 Tax=Collimonas sp. (strain OK412) TaxID=1801619 RepID=UPI0008EC93E0|nr:hypothetical protein [Collimonas sp. OK412]SFB97729.1 hypothetical protein SAMN04515619_103248 [Collimonas sp. OK412]